MINFLLDWLNIDKEPFFSAMKKYIKPTDTVCVVPFSFGDGQTRCAEDWKRLYDGEGSYYYHRMTAPFTAYGISADRIAVVNYFEDSRETAAEKIRLSDILFLPGGVTKKTLERIDEFDLRGVIKEFSSVIMGASAGALAQLGEYHTSPYHEEFPDFRYCKGLGLVGGFYLEVHYEGVEEQKDSIKRVLRERGKTVYATVNGRGALIFEDGKVTPVGEVLRFDKEGDVI